MAADFVSEVDRKFFSNNMLSNDDWDSTNMDLSDLLNGEFPTDELVNSLQNDFPSCFDGDSLPILSGSTLHDDLMQELSDSSDSGISGVINQYDVQSPDIKHEPLSPASSLSSENSDSTSIQMLTDTTLINESPPSSPFQYTVEDGKVCILPDLSVPVLTEPEDVKPTIVFGTQLVGTNLQAPVQNINSIMNSKVKIQPKPLTNTSSITTTPVQQHAPLSPVTNMSVPKTEPGKPLVLTPEEFQRLTDQGLLKFQPPTTQPTKVVKPIHVASPTLNIHPSSIINVDNDIKSMKRQQRMIKNRESASLSRKRKKEYLTSLEEQIKEYNLENQQLKHENINLKKKLELLQSENEQLKKSSPFSPAKKICLMAIFVLFSLNFASFRLAEQLAGWMDRHEKTKTAAALKKNKNKLKQKKLSPLQASLQKMKAKHRLRQKYAEYNYQVQLFQGSEDRDFWKAVSRRNDTFYVLSFNEDYFLVPAVAHNKTMRPRMSLMMPAVALNESMQPPAGKIGMMQIDCEVLNTQLIHVQKSAIPQHFTQRNSSFTRSEEESFFPSKEG
ncbi:hypothetical protein KUTeg_022411 [Tegillarca granosa]|uniref:BZIP domain-containing protein n=1 Tax=Tegillarca granosa TaxID=220873 RepID=A0ABQ9E6H7_TEGGR|nr:hypothetical protein KUTeg_022411 [Tegillarca granosa]